MYVPHAYAMRYGPGVTKDFDHFHLEYGGSAYGADNTIKITQVGPYAGLMSFAVDDYVDFKPLRPTRIALEGDPPEEVVYDDVWLDKYKVVYVSATQMYVDCGEKGSFPACDESANYLLKTDEY